MQPFNEIKAARAHRCTRFNKVFIFMIKFLTPNANDSIAKFEVFIIKVILNTAAAAAAAAQLYL